MQLKSSLWLNDRQVKVLKSLNENHFVNFTEATLALTTHVYTSMLKGRLHQQVGRATWKSILSQTFFSEKQTSNE